MRASTATDGRRLTEAEFAAMGRRLAELVEEFEELPLPRVRQKVFELLQTVDALHREGLARLIESLSEHSRDAQLEQALADPIVRTLLMLYDLAPMDPVTQVEAALESIRPYIQSHGGEVEVLDVVEGTVHLRLSGSCEACPASRLTLKRGIEAALREQIPGFKGIQVHDPAPPPAPVRSFIPLQQVGTARQLRRPVFAEVAGLDKVPPGTMKAFDVNGVRVLVANVGGEVYAVGSSCPGSMAPLELGSFSPPVVTCPWHNEAYDVRTGKRVDGHDEPSLSVLPITIAGGIMRLAVSTATGSTNQSPR